MFADFKCRFIIIITHNSGSVEDKYKEIIARDRIWQLFPLKSEDFSVEFVHFAENF